MKSFLVLLTMISSLSAFAESDCQKKLDELQNRSYQLGLLNSALDTTNNYLNLGVIVTGYVGFAEQNRQALRDSRNEFIKKEYMADDRTESFIKECMK